MAKYGNFVYGGSTYGEVRKLAYSVEPMGVVVLSFSTAYVTWYSPSGTFTRIRLVRNQIGFPETSEDGVIVWEEYASEGTVSRSSITDGVDNPTSVGIVAGRPIYYSMFLFTDQKIWVNAGSVSDTVPRNHDSQRKMMDVLPRVYTSAIQSPLGVVDETTALYSFIDGVSLTYEQLLTELELLRPTHSTEITSHLLLPVETSNVGLDQEPNISIKNQKRLVREAFSLYSHRGQKLGLENYIESLTGYAPEVTVSSNLLLTPQDSTFYMSLGNWVFENATAEYTDEQVVSSLPSTVIDTVYSCKVTATNAFSMTLGNVSPITHGIPVKENTDYIASAKVKSPPSDGDTSITIHWYDNKGDYISSDFGPSVATNNTWKIASSSATSPAGATYVSLEISSNSDGQYYIDQVCMQLGDTVSYDEARAIDVFLLPNKTNYIKNPSFESNVTDGWTKTGLATVAQDVDVSDLSYSGVKSAKVTATGSWTFTSNTFPIEEGIYYTASGLIKTTTDITISFIARDLLGDVVESVDVYPLGTSIDWSRFQATDLVGSEAVTAVTYEVVFSGEAGTFYLDCIQFERGVAPSEYFDGSIPSNFGAIWDGVPDNSYSHLYVNKPFKVPRLSQTIGNWIPPNSFWRIRTYEQVEYTNLTV